MSDNLDPHGVDPHDSNDRSAEQIDAHASEISSHRRPERGSPTRSWVIGAAIAAAAGVGSFAAANLASAQEPTTTVAESADGTAKGDDAKGDCERGEGGGERDGRGEGTGRGRGVRGTVSAVDGSTITVTDSDGESVSVTSDDTTTVLEASTAEFSDLAVGQRVRVRGERSEDGATITATAVTANDAAASETTAPSDAEGNNTGGADTSSVIASLSAEGFTITKADGSSVNVVVNAATTYTRVTASAVSDIAVGDTVSVHVGRRPASTDNAGVDSSDAEASPDTSSVDASTVAARSIVIGDVDDAMIGGGRGGRGGHHDGPRGERDGSESDGSKSENGD